MDITWYGHSCFRLRFSCGTVVTDPFAESIGRPPLALAADLVTISHDHPGHNNAAAVGGAPFVVAGPGEYEAKGIFIVGVRLDHDARAGGHLGHTTAYCISADDLTICHMGDVGHPLSQAQVEALGAIDVLLLPVGGHRTIGSGIAAEVVSMLDPALVVPMHFQSAGRPELEPLDKFLKEMGVAHVEPEEVLKVAGGRLPDEPQVAVLRARA